MPNMFCCLIAWMLTAYDMMIWSRRRDISRPCCCINMKCRSVSAGTIPIRMERVDLRGPLPLRQHYSSYYVMSSSNENISICTIFRRNMLKFCLSCIVWAMSMTVWVWQRQVWRQYVAWWCVCKGSAANAAHYTNVGDIDALDTIHGGTSVDKRQQQTDAHFMQILMQIMTFQLKWRHFI